MQVMENIHTLYVKVYIYMYDMLPLSVGTAGPNTLTLFKVTPGYPDIKLLAGQKQTNFKQIKIKKMHEI